MAQAIALVAAKIAAAKFALTGTYMAALGVSSATAGFLASATLTVGFNIASGALMRGLGPSAPKPEDGQVSSKQAIPPRIVYFGRMKVSGPWWFAEAKNGSFYKVLAINHGLIDAIEEYWIDDTEVTLNGSSLVNEAPYTGKIKIQTRLGLSTETAYSDLDTAFTEYTSSHRGDGVATLYSRFDGVGADRFLSTYPNGANTTPKLVIRGVKNYDFDNENTTWSDNAARVIYWWLTNSDAMDIDPALLTTPQALAGWEAAQATCDENVNLAAGGTEKRWRLWGGANLAAERHGDVLARMMACCDGKLARTADGGVYLRPGKWVEPTIIITKTDIVGAYNVTRGANAMNVANTIKATFLDVPNGYISNQIQPWVDTASVAARGEVVATPDFTYAPSHGQARRLAKKTAYMLNPDWSGTFELKLSGLKAFGERYIRIQYPAWEIDHVFEIQSESLIMEGDTVIGLTIEVISMPEASDEWDEDTEEGTAPGDDTTSVTSTVPVPANFAVEITALTVGSSQAAVASITWDAPTDDGLKTELRYKKTSASVWLAISVNLGDLEAQSPVLDDGAEYEFQARHVSLGGTASAWTSSVTIIVGVGDLTAPDLPTNLSASGGVGQAIIRWRNPNSSNFSTAKVYRAASGAGFGAASDASGDLTGALGADMDVINTSVPAGIYDYWVTSKNASSVESGPAGPVTATVT